MHDFHIANRIANLVLEHAKKNKLKKVFRVKVALGSVLEHGQKVSALNLKFNLGMLLKGTKAENSRIVVTKSKGDSWVLREIEGE